MSTKTLSKATAAFILSEGEGSISRETVTISAGNSLAAGTVLGKITATGEYAAHDPGAADGSETAAGVLYAAVDATAADAKGVAIVRLSEIADAELTWHTGITGGEKTAATTALAANYVIIR